MLRASPYKQMCTRSCQRCCARRVALVRDEEVVVVNRGRSSLSWSSDMAVDVGCDG